jgi:hypothetical protein
VNEGIDISIDMIHITDILQFCIKITDFCLFGLPDVAVKLIQDTVGLQGCKDNRKKIKKRGFDGSDSDADYVSVQSNGIKFLD